MRKTLAKICSLFLLIFFISSALAADDSKKLNKLNTQIHQIKAYLGKTFKRQSDLKKELKETESKINKLNRKLLNNERQFAIHEKKLKELLLTKEALQKSIQSERGLLSHEVVSAYKLGKVDYLKVVFSQEDPEMLGRLLMYYRYFSKNREKRIASYQGYLNELEENHLHIQDVTEAQKGVDEALKRERSELKKQFQQHRKILNNLNNQIKDKKRQLAQLVRNQKNLEKVIGKVRNKKNSPALSNASKKTALHSLQGRLKWPVRGKMSARFNARIEQSHLKSKGVIIAAPEGRSVKAVAPGRVVFSKWLRGYGLLMIIDHGEGFMTLYGYNSRLYKNTGDQVELGEKIASVGQKSTNGQSALYFEMRKNGNALDPSQWCS